MVTIYPPLVHLCQQGHHFRMQHRRKKFDIERRVAEPLLEPVSFVIGTLGVDLHLMQLILGRRVIPEGLGEFGADPDFEN